MVRPLRVMSPLIPLTALAAAVALLWPRRSVAASITVGDPSEMDIAAKHNTIDNQTRGERNNNPGNVAASPLNDWKGQIGDDGTYCIFDQDTNGIRAMAHVLKSYQRRGVQTIHDMIFTYTATDRAAYSKNVADALGLQESDVPDLSDLDTLVDMVTAMIHQENGRVSYTREHIQLAVQL